MARKTTLTFFYAKWCGPCVKMKRIIEEIECELVKSLTVTKINIEEVQRTDKMPLITRLPTILIFTKEKREYRLTGLQTKNKLVRLCD